MERNYYAGIGSRETPAHVLEIMRVIGFEMASRGWTLRSGGARGADSAFEYGCDLVNGDKQIFLPFKNYNNNPSLLYTIPQAAFQLIDSTWNDVQTRSTIVRQMFSRNCQQILGPALNDPSSVVVCWTPGGRIVGGTGRAIVIAKNAGIPVVNLHNIKDADTFFNIL